MRKFISIIAICLIMPCIAFGWRISGDAGNVWIIDTNGAGLVEQVSGSSWTVTVWGVTASSTTNNATVWQGTADWDVLISSPNDGITIYQATHDNHNVNANSQQGNSDVGIGNPMYVILSTNTPDSSIYTSTGTSGRLTANGTIPDTAFLITNPSFRVTGGTATVTGFLGGTIYLKQGIAWNPGQLQEPVNSPTIVVAVESGVTINFDYTLIGKQ